MRVFSATIAIIALFAIYNYFANRGIFYVCTVASLIAIIEYNQLAFNDVPNKWIKHFLFPVLGALLLFISLYSPQKSTEFWAFLLCFYLCIYIWAFSNVKTNEWLFLSLTKGAIGFFYTVLLPIMALKTLDLHYGNIWFLLLLTIVLCGDTFAYFGGLKFGRRKLSPQLSPQKTLEGSLFGFIGSLVAVVIIWYLHFSDLNLLWFIFLGITAGLFAQTGDFFESLIKRIANVKDSGRIMPGHGGILDRIDGVLFASPIVYLFAFNAEKFLF
ncbi:MAG: phosphatidate cytidylyltransferase [Bdellovibrionales bacterium]|nr:phosphatidate cytidylyltransferase [Bdellovibrionales bacterium]